MHLLPCSSPVGVEENQAGVYPGPRAFQELPDKETVYREQPRQFLADAWRQRRRKDLTTAWS
jgi:hypothetical protein